MDISRAETARRVDALAPAVDRAAATHRRIAALSKRIDRPLIVVGPPMAMYEAAVRVFSLSQAA